MATVLLGNFIATAIYKLVSSDKEHYPGFDLSPSTDPNAVTRGQRNNILHVAVRNKETADVENIVNKYPLLVGQTNARGDTPLHMAARLGKTNAAKAIVESVKELEAGDNGIRLLRQVNDKGQTALHEAVHNGHYDVALFMIEKDKMLTSLVNKAGESPLFLAVDGGHKEIVDEILKTSRLYLSISGRNGMTAMHAATIRNQPDLAKNLLSEYGSNILNMADDLGWMPHHYAASMGLSKIIETFFLDETGRELAYIKDKEGMCALHIAAKNGHSEAIKTLIRMCPHICELLDNEDRTALHIAAKEKRVFAVHALLNSVAFNDLLNEQDIDGNTALHLACISGYYEIILRLVIDSRTNRRTINNMGMTALDIINKSTILGPFDKFMIKCTWSRENDPLSNSLQEEVASATSWDTRTRKETTISSETKPKSILMSAQIRQTDPQPSDPSVEKDRKTPDSKEQNDHQNVIKNTAEINSVVATIIVSITYAAAMQMPGGFDETSGFAILRNQTSFRSFLGFNSLAFGCSAATMLIHFAVRAHSKLRGHGYKYPIRLTRVLTLVSISCTVLAFIMATDAVLDKKQTEPHSKAAFTLPGNLAFTAFLTTLLYFFLPLLMAFMNYLISLFPDRQAIMPFSTTQWNLKKWALDIGSSFVNLFKIKTPRGTTS